MDTDSLSTALTAAAARLDLHGEVLRGRASVITRQREAVRWHSLGARACQVRTESVVALLLAISARLAGVGDDLRRCSLHLANPP